MQFFYMINGSHNGISARQMKGYVAARESHVSGYWKDGKPYLPDMESLKSLIPYRWRKALSRAQVWTKEDAARQFECIYCTLYNARGKYLATIYFQPAKER